MFEKHQAHPEDDLHSCKWRCETMSTRQDRVTMPPCPSNAVGQQIPVPLRVRTCKRVNLGCTCLLTPRKTAHLHPRHVAARNLPCCRSHGCGECSHPPGGGGGWELPPSQKNMSQTRRTELQGSVREKAHMNHSVMYRMGSIFCLLRCL